MQKKDAKPMILRWSLRSILLRQEFDMEIKDMKGLENRVAYHLLQIRIEDYVPLYDFLPIEKVYKMGIKNMKGVENRVAYHLSQIRIKDDVPIYDFHTPVALARKHISPTNMKAK